MKNRRFISFDLQSIPVQAQSQCRERKCVNFYTTLVCHELLTHIDFRMPYDDQISLAGKLLIAMPGIEDDRFDRSVIFICAHSAKGAMGVIVNRPLEPLNLQTFLSSLDITPIYDLSHQSVLYGGPVEPSRGFVLHSPDVHCGEDTMFVSKSFAMTATLKMLEKIADGAGPQRGLVAVGYAGWGPGQLDEEILENGWLTVTPGPGLVFSNRNDSKWTEALHLLGVAPQVLSGTAGHA